MRPEPLPEPDDEPSIFDEEDEAHIESRIRAGEAAAAAGRGTPHALVAERLSRVGTPEATDMLRRMAQVI